MEKRPIHDEKKVMDNPGTLALTFASSNDRQHCRMIGITCKCNFFPAPALHTLPLVHEQLLAMGPRSLGD
jgi:hypothetical protein